MKLEELREEIIALGAENIAAEEGGDERINRWINQAHRWLCDYKPWPFLFDEQEGPAPLTIADLGHVVAVSDVTNRSALEPATLNQLLLGDPNLDGVGGAQYWYTEDGKTIKVYPASGATFNVRYRRVPVALGDADEPLVPEDYQELLITRARVEVYKATDNFEAAAEILKDCERGRDEMVHALMKPNYDKERRITRTGRAGDYL